MRAEIRQQYTRGEKDYSQRFSDPTNKYEWSHTVIRGIIGNPVYLGHTIMCKHETVFKVGLLKKTPDADRIRVDNTHEPLVSQEIFDNANAKILSRKREDTSGNVSIFSGLIKCGTCGKAMSQRYWVRDRHRIFVCNTYAKNTQRCTDHRIFYDDLYDAVLADIQCHAQLAYEDKDKAVALAIRMNAKAEGGRAKSSEGKLKQARKRYDEVTRMFDRLYEDSLSGRNLYLDEAERRRLVFYLNEFRNKLIAQGCYTDCVDELLVKTVNAKAVKI